MDAVLYIFVALTLLAFLFGIRAIYFGYKLRFYLRKCYPEKAAKYVFCLRPMKQLFNEDIDDPVFLRLRSKVKNAQNCSAGAILAIIVLMLLLVLSAFLFGRPT
jgi:hypothetical protein